MRPDEVISAGRPILHWELTPPGRVVATVIGDVTRDGLGHVIDTFGRIGESVHTVDLRFVATVDDPLALTRLGALGVEQVIVAPDVWGALRAARSEIEFVRPAGPPLLHRAVFGVGVHDADLRYVYVNDELARINGVPAQAHYGYRPAEVFDVVDDELTAVLRRVLETRRAEWHDVDAIVDGDRGVWRCYYGPAELENGLGLISIVDGLTFDARASVGLRVRRRRTAEGAMSSARVAPSGSDHDDLTGREREVLELIATGASNQQIADRLFLSVDTIKTYCRRLYRKLGVANRTEAARFASRSTTPPTPASDPARSGPESGAPSR